jgi:LytS/YehU family sensor histidine kinase
LTALKILIKEAPDTAQNYVNSLSRALRYTLKSNEKQLVTLKDEMEFMESYLFLIRMRFGDNLSINTGINKDLLSHKLPPLTIQTLVENAIKHNEISRRNPLCIDILTTDIESLKIINDIHEKITGEEGTGIGLVNLSKQFQLLINKEIIVRKEDNKFSVEVPLIRP